MSSSTVKVFAPATIANLSVGYDVLGLALHQPGDEVILRKNKTGKVTISKISGDEGKLPYDPTKNTVSTVIIDYLKQRNLDFGVDIELNKKMPFGSGLGSSSASAVAGLVAINALADMPWEKKLLLPLAMEGERVACGIAHADNVAPSLLGGVTLIRSYHPLEVIKLPFPEHLHLGLVYPHVNIPTSQARRILPQKVTLKDASVQWGNLGGLVAGFCLKDVELIGNSMNDILIEPVRSLLIPYFDALKNIALHQGALNFGISGSGPTMFILTNDERTSSTIADQIQRYLKERNVNSNTYLSKINPEGALVLS